MNLGPQEYEDWIRDTWGGDESAKAIARAVIPFLFWVWWHEQYPNQGEDIDLRNYEDWKRTRKMIESN